MPARLTPRQRAYVRKRTTIPDPDPSELDEELNIVPFLDIVVNIIMFLLMTLTTVAFFSQVEAALPQYRTGGIGKRAAENEALNLNVTITRAGVIGSSKRRTPVASKIAFAITAPMVIIAGSPPPCGSGSPQSTSTVSISGTHEKRGS